MKSLKKLRTIKQFGAFKDFDWKTVKDESNNELSFKEINFIFGHNYAGKTTLSRITRAFERRELPEHYDGASFELEFDDGSIAGEGDIATTQIPFRVFNSDFVIDNLRFLRDTRDENNEIRAFAIIGEKNVEREKTIKRLRSIIGKKTKDEVTGLYKDIADATVVKSSCDAAYRKATKILTTAKQNLAKSIKDDYLSCGDHTYDIKSLGKELNEVLSDDFVDIENESDLLKLTQENVREKVVPASLPILKLTELIKRAKTLLAREVVDVKRVELFISQEFLEWGRQGYGLHIDQHKKCAFCGQDMPDERWSQLKAEFENEGERLIAEINALLKDVRVEMEAYRPESFISPNSFYAPYVEQAVSLEASYTKILSEYNQAFTPLVAALESRIKSIAIAIPGANFNDPTTKMNAVRTAVYSLCEENNQFAASLKDKKAEAQRLIRLHRVSVGYRERDIARFVQEELDCKSAADSAQNKLNELNDEFKRKVTELKKELSAYADEEKAANQINAYLALIEDCPLRLVAEEITEEEGHKRKIFRIKRCDQIAYNLSEGECNLIAFCYFVATLHQTTGTKPIVWIDDPISSLDANHIYFVYALIRDAILEKQLFSQLFISTHSMDFWRLMMKLQLWIDPTKPHTKVPIERFHVRHVGGSATIEPLPEYLKHYITEFVHLFSVIYDAAFIKESDQNYLDVIHSFGNCARRFLELYLFYRFPHTTKDGSYAEREKLHEAMGDMVTTFIVERITNEGSHTASSLEEGAHPSYVKEINDVAKRIMLEMNSHDPIQFKFLIDAIGKENPFDC